MEGEGKAHLEIIYCVTCGYFGMASWIANEIWHGTADQLAIQFTPAGNSRLEVLLDGEKLFDLKAEGGKFPSLSRVWDMKDAAIMKIDDVKAKEAVARAAARVAKAAPAQS